MKINKLTTMQTPAQDIESEEIFANQKDIEKFNELGNDFISIKMARKM